MQYLTVRLADRDLNFTVTDAAFDLSRCAGYDPVYGARPLKRAIQQSIENPLVQQILSDVFVPGDTIVVERNGDESEFHK